MRMFSCLAEVALLLYVRRDAFGFLCNGELVMTVGVVE
jgi:hypothetical protein